MFELDIEMLKEQGLQLVDSAKKTAQDLADKGKNKLDLLNQQARLSTCVVRQRSARSARPKWTATRCSATTAALSCKPRKTTRQRGFRAGRVANT